MEAACLKTFNTKRTGSRAGWTAVCLQPMHAYAWTLSAAAQELRTGDCTVKATLMHALHCPESFGICWQLQLPEMFSSAFELSVYTLIKAG